MAASWSDNPKTLAGVPGSQLDPRADTVKCHACGGSIRRHATRCRHCGEGASLSTADARLHDAHLLAVREDMSFYDALQVVDETMTGLGDIDGGGE